MAPWRRASSSSAATVATSDPARTLVGNVRVSPEISAEDKGEADEGTWSALVPELLSDILRRVNDGAEWFPCRRDLVACAGVCRRWREASVALVQPPLEGGGDHIPFVAEAGEPAVLDSRVRFWRRMRIFEKEK
jgi:tubby and related proteins